MKISKIAVWFMRSAIMKIFHNLEFMRAKVEAYKIQ